MMRLKNLKRSDFSPRSNLFPWLLAACLFPGIGPSAVPAVADTGDACAAAGEVPFDRSVDGTLEAGDDLDLFRLDVPQPGLLALDVSGLDRQPIRPVLVFLGTDCRPTRSNAPTEEPPGDFRGSPSGGTRHLHRVSAGVHYFAVAGPGLAAAGQYRVQTGFAPHPEAGEGDGIDLTFDHQIADGGDLRVVTAVTRGDALTLDRLIWGRAGDDTANDDKADPVKDPLDEDDPLTGGVTVASTAAGASRSRTGDTVVIGVDEPGVLAIESSTAAAAPEAAAARTWIDVLAGGSAAVALPPRRSADPTTLSVRFYALCPRAELDDHGETFACASEIDLGSSLAAEIGGTEVPDRDLFSFVLRRRTTVILRTLGDVDTHGQLFDHRGTLLATADDGGPDSGFRLARILDPGRYFLRVDADGWSEGPYRLATAHAPLPEPPPR